MADDCRITSDADCQRTRGCKERHRCSFVDNRCVVAGDDCRHTRACQELGACTAVDGTCVVGSDEDCAGAAVCQRNGWCKRRSFKYFDGDRPVCFTDPPG